MNGTMLLQAPFAALGAGILLQVLLGRWISGQAKSWLAALSGLLALVPLLALAPGVAGGSIAQATLFQWDRDVQVALRADGLSLLFALMATGIGSAILIYCVGYMRHEQSLTRFYSLMLTFIAGLALLVFSTNLLMVYLSWETIGLCSYFLVGFWYKQRAAADGARKVLLMTHLPGYGLLLAILLLNARSGTWNWTDPRLTAEFTSGIFLLMLAAAMAKSVIFPLHTWIPEAMNAPTPVSALLHSACYVKAGVYLVARMFSFTGGFPGNGQIVVLALGCATMLVGALFALAQTDLKRLLAFSTISQLGYIITGLGLGTPAGLAAGLFYCFSHGLFKGTLFLCAGSVQHGTGTRDMSRLGGLAEVMPHTARTWLVAAAAIIGLPLTNGFVAKWLLLDAALSAGQAVVVIIAWLVSAITAFYLLKATVSVFYGQRPPELGTVHEADLPMRVGMGMLAGLCLLFGIAPQLLLKAVVTPAVTALGAPSPVSLTWLGFQLANNSIQITAGAALLLLALLVGWGLSRLLHVGTGPAPVKVFTGGDPLPDGDRLQASDFADLAEAACQPIYQVTNPDPVYRALGAGIGRAAQGLRLAVAPLERQPYLAVLVLAAVVFLAIWWR